MSQLSPLQAAAELCRVSGWSISNLKVQKLLYLAELLYTGEHGGEDQLISGHFEAWDYGPVLPEAYRALKMFGSRPVENIFRTVPEIQDPLRKQMLHRAYDHFGSWTASQLVNVTHWEYGAWAKNYAPGSFAEIKRQDILDEYRARQRRT
jgi:uncharacterized phage-associated protein